MRVRVGVCMRAVVSVIHLTSANAIYGIVRMRLYHIHSNYHT